MNEKWNLVTSVLILDEFYESSIPTGDFFFDGYTRSDAALTHRTRENLVVRFAVENLFDENYEEAIGFPATGIRARIGINEPFTVLNKTRYFTPALVPLDLR